MSDSLMTAEASGGGTATTDFTRRLRFEAPPEKVFAALTSQSGLASWWTAVSSVSGETVEGGKLRFTFHDIDEPLVVVVDSVRPPSSLVWSVLECGVLPDWVGTSPTFSLTAFGDGGCELEFRHIGLTPKLECYDICSSSTQGWGYYLPILQGYVDSEWKSTRT